jgi:hypothetical protein
MNEYNDKHEPHGYWEIYWGDSNEHLMFKGIFINGIESGYWEWNSIDSKLKHKAFYL